MLNSLKDGQGIFRLQLETANMRVPRFRIADHNLPVSGCPEMRLADAVE
jgi:hypothetical protein